VTPVQAAAFVNAQSVSAQIELAAMHAANHAREQQGHSHAYDEGAFLGLLTQYHISHDEVIEIFRDTLNDYGA